MKRDPTQLHIARSHGHLDNDMHLLRLFKLYCEEKICFNYVLVNLTSGVLNSSKESLERLSSYEGLQCEYIIVWVWVGC